MHTIPLSLPFSLLPPISSSSFSLSAYPPSSSFVSSLPLFGVSERRRSKPFFLRTLVYFRTKPSCRSISLKASFNISRLFFYSLSFIVLLFFHSSFLSLLFFVIFVFVYFRIFYC